MTASQGLNCIPQWTSITGSTIGEANITITPVLNNCPGIPETFQISVLPKPIINPIGPFDYCHNELAPNICFTANVPAEFIWTRSGDAIGSQVAGTTNCVPGFTANNPSSPGTDLCANFNILPKYTSNNLICYGDPGVVEVCVHPLPEINAGNDTLLCIGQCMTLNATGSGFGSVNYTWNQVFQGQSFCPTNTVTLFVNGIDQNLCQDSDNITVNFVNAAPPVVNAGPDASICLGASYTLNATGDAIPFVWNNGLYSNGNQIIPNEASQTDTFFVEGISPVTQCISRDTVLLNVNPLPNVLIIASDNSICNGETAILTANGALSYQWTSGPNNPIYSVSSTGVYEVIGYDINNCSDTAEITIIVNPLPNPMFSSNMNVGGCLPFCPILTDETVSPASASVVWDFGNSTTSNQTGSVTTCYDDYGCYNVTLTATTAEGCSASITQQNYLCVNEIEADFSVDPISATQSILNPEFEFVNNSSNAIQYEWYFGDAGYQTPQSYLENTGHTYQDAGFYMVTLVASSEDGCSDTVRKEITVTDELILYVPNSFTPDGDELNDIFIPVIKGGYDRKSGYLLNIYNRWGEIIFTTDQVGIGWDGTFEGKEAPIGTYTWLIQIKDSFSTKVNIHNGHVNLIR
jgi:gliding motility-associated-like protein